MSLFIIVLCLFVGEVATGALSRPLGSKSSLIEQHPVHVELEDDSDEEAKHREDAMTFITENIDSVHSVRQ